MRYYLDTNILVFVLKNDKREFCAETLHILEDYANIFYVSSFAVRELLALYREGKLEHLRYKSYKDLFALFRKLDYEIKPATEKHLFAYAELEPAADHRDPNDHMIIAQAISDKIPLISSDNKFKLYESQGLQLVFNKR